MDGLYALMSAMQDPRGGRTKTRKTLGNALLLLGGAFIASYLGVRGWSSSQSAAGLEAFEQARSAAVISSAVAAEPMGELSIAATTAAAANQWSGVPDTSMWSSKRIDDYNAALAAQDEDAPHAVLDIDHLNIRVPVYNGAEEFNLNRGVARIVGTGRIGEVGNLGIAGHRDGFFRPLKDIELGDRFTLETYYGTDVYEVTSIEIVDPSDLHVLAPTDTPTVTLVTCYPFYYVGHAPQRFIVKAEAINNQVNS